MKLLFYYVHSVFLDILKSSQECWLFFPDCPEAWAWELPASDALFALTFQDRSQMIHFLVDEWFAVLL